MAIAHGLVAACWQEQALAAMAGSGGCTWGLALLGLGTERDVIAVTILDSSAAWASATRMVAANRDLLVAIAGVFYLLPGLAGAVFVPSPTMTSGMTEAQMLHIMQDYYASSLPALLGLSLLPMVGMLTMLVVMLDAARPTVAQAIRQSLRALPSYFASQLLIALAILPLSLAMMLVLTLFLPDRIALSVAFGILLYPIMRTMLIGPVVAGRIERNPVAAIRESIRLTKGNAGRILLFIGLAGFVFLVVYGLAMMFVGVVLVLMFKGEPQRLIGEGVAGVLLAVGYTYFVAMLAAIHSQLAAPKSGTASG
jgi:hypothetical protein